MQKKKNQNFQPRKFNQKQQFKIQRVDVLSVQRDWENCEIFPVCSLHSFFPQQSPKQTFMGIQLTANK